MTVDNIGCQHRMMQAIDDTVDLNDVGRMAEGRKVEGRWKFGSMPQMPD